jgi:hypothetical protein
MIAKKEILDMLSRITNHKFVELTKRGNAAILEAMRCVKKLKGTKPILTPDQGGWVTYLKYPGALGLGLRIVKTDKALINLQDLKKKTKGAGAFLYAQPGGYFVAQPSRKIYRLCRKNNCMVIMDVTGTIGTPLCNGDHADILVCSFGRYKPVNLGYGGFISSNEKFISTQPDKFESEKLQLLAEKLGTLRKRQEFFQEINKKIKKDLNGFDIIHKDKKGINVLVKFNNEGQKEEIIRYCEKNNFKYKLCKKVPDSTKNLFSFIKVNENAVSIEVQRLG